MTYDVKIHYLASLASFSSGPFQVKGPQALLLPKHYIKFGENWACHKSHLFNHKPNRVKNLQGTAYLGNWYCSLYK